MERFRWTEPRASAWREVPQSTHTPASAKPAADSPVTLRWGTLTTMYQAKGSFEVQRQGEPPYDTADGVILSRTRFDKQFRGGLEATSSVEMLSAMTPVQGSAGYVAIERVTGTLAGRSGSFVLQHSGTMTRGAATLSLTVVPDSGTGELAGLTGKMAIEVAAGEHFYTFDYGFEQGL